MRAARKCGLIRETHSTRCSSGRSRRPLRNLLQNRPEKQIPSVPPIVAKSVFVEVGLQVLRADAVVHAADSTLYKTPKSLNRLSVDVARDVDSRAVVNPAMSVSLRFQSIVGDKLIGVHSAGRKNVFLRKTVQGRLLRVWRYASHHAPDATVFAAFDHSHNCNLVAVARRPSAPSLPKPLSAVVHLIHLHRRSLQLHSIFGEQGADLPEHAPCSFVGDASLSLNLLRGDSAASRTHEVHCVEPSLERGSCLFKDAPGERVDVIPAMVARVGSTASHAVMLALDAALLAVGNAVRPALLFDVLKAGVIVRKLNVEIRYGVAQMFRNALFGLHGRYRLPEGLLVVKG